MDQKGILGGYGFNPIQAQPQPEDMIEYTVGSMIAGKLRDYLNGEKFKGRKIDFFEGKGFIERKFIIRGNRADIAHIEAVMADYIERIKR